MRQNGTTGNLRITRMRELPVGQIDLVPSSRANGSRECAPDDRLREAIQIHERDWIALSLSLLAMTAFSNRTKRKYFFRDW